LWDDNSGLCVTFYYFTVVHPRENYPIIWYVFHLILSYLLQAYSPTKLQRTFYSD